MKFLVEQYGQSDQLDEFIRLINHKFSKYYDVIILSKDKTEQHNYFAFVDAAKDYYDTMLNEMLDDKEYYDAYQISLVEETVKTDSDELEYKMIDVEE